MYFPSSKNPEWLENGSSTIVEVNGIKVLVSNEHVVENIPLLGRFSGSEETIPVATQYLGVGAPIDIGIAKILPEAWEKHGSGAGAVAFDRFADKHATVPHEILWIAGYPGERVRPIGDHVFSVCEATPTQEWLFSDDSEADERFSPDTHFAVYYSPGNAQKIDESSATSGAGRATPPGLSGTLVWNTRRLECLYENRPWHPSVAVVTGIVWGWPSENYLIATKVEHFREFLRVASAGSFDPQVSEPSEPLEEA